jgi:hypothetical protein
MAAKRKRGRPTDPEAKRRRRMIGVRLRDETRARLELDAAAAGRSLSQEVEQQIEQRHERGSLLSDALEIAYGRQVAGLLMIIGRVLTDAGRYGGFMSKPSTAGTDAWIEDHGGVPTDRRNHCAARRESADTSHDRQRRRPESRRGFRWWRSCCGSRQAVD